MELVPRETIRSWVREYGGRVRHIAQAFSEGPVEAEDIFQETFIVAWRKGGGFLRDDSGVGAWLCQIALNVGRENYRKSVRREALLARWLERAQPSIHSPAIDDELIRLSIWKAIARLPQRQQTVLLLRVVDEIPSKEVAARMEITDGTVRATLRDALRSLRRQIEGLDISHISRRYKIEGR